MLPDEQSMKFQVKTIHIMGRTNFWDSDITDVPVFSVEPSKVDMSQTNQVRLDKADCVGASPRLLKSSANKNM